MCRKGHHDKYGFRLRFTWKYTKLKFVRHIKWSSFLLSIHNTVVEIIQISK